LLHWRYSSYYRNFVALINSIFMIIAWLFESKATKTLYLSSRSFQGDIWLLFSIDYPLCPCALRMTRLGRVGRYGQDGLPGDFSAIRGVSAGVCHASGFDGEYFRSLKAQSSVS
jgi:hypothetical protein